MRRASGHRPGSQIAGIRHGMEENDGGMGVHEDGGGELDQRREGLCQCWWAGVCACVWHFAAIEWGRVDG